LNSFLFLHTYLSVLHFSCFFLSHCFILLFSLPLSVIGFLLFFFHLHRISLFVCFAQNLSSFILHKSAWEKKKMENKKDKSDISQSCSYLVASLVLSSAFCFHFLSTDLGVCRLGAELQCSPCARNGGDSAGSHGAARSQHRGGGRRSHGSGARSGSVHVLETKGHQSRPRGGARSRRGRRSQMQRE
jgi:uncharacterized membrane protein YgcG